MPDDTVGQHNDSPQEWGRCGSGEIARMVRRIKTRRRTKFGAQLAGGALLGVLLGFGFLQLRSAWVDARAGTEIAGVTCREVREKAQAFRDGTLPKDERDRIAAHLEECEECAKLVRTEMERPNGTQREGNAGRSLSRLPDAAPVLAAAR
ncbi:MAG: zf-HC2 domain-containing protein [Planctomycetaceae bacterium]